MSNSFYHKDLIQWNKINFLFYVLEHYFLKKSYKLIQHCARYATAKNKQSAHRAAVKIPKFTFTTANVPLAIKGKTVLDDGAFSFEKIRAYIEKNVQETQYRFFQRIKNFRHKATRYIS